MSDKKPTDAQENVTLPEKDVPNVTEPGTGIPASEPGDSESCNGVESPAPSEPPTPRNWIVKKSTFLFTHPRMRNTKFSMETRLNTKILEIQPLQNSDTAAVNKLFSKVEEFTKGASERVGTALLVDYTYNGLFLLMDNVEKWLEELKVEVMISTFDPIVMPVKPIEPGIRFIKNEKDVTDSAVYIVVTEIGEGQPLFTTTAVNSLNGVLLAPNVFIALLGKDPSHLVRRDVIDHLERVKHVFPSSNYKYRFIRASGKHNLPANLLEELERESYQSHHPTCSLEGDSSKFPQGVNEDPLGPLSELADPASSGKHNDKPTLRERFLSKREPSRIPPRPDSERYQHEVAVMDAIGKARNSKPEEVIQELQRSIEERPVGSVPLEELEKDTAIKALGLLQRAQENKRKQVVRSRLWKLFTVMLLAAIGWGIYEFEYYLFERGYTTSVVECSAPFGDNRITGKRYVTNEFRSLFGVRVSFDSNIKDVTKIDLTGEAITILGMDNAGGKWWRKNITKGNMGAEPVKPADSYWFVGGKDTAVVSYKNFCVKG